MLMLDDLGTLQTILSIEPKCKDHDVLIFVMQIVRTSFLLTISNTHNVSHATKSVSVVDLFIHSP